MLCWRGKILQLLKGFRSNCSTLMHCNSSLQSSGSNSCTNLVNHIWYSSLYQTNDRVRSLKSWFCSELYHLPPLFQCSACEANGKSWQSPTIMGMEWDFISCGHQTCGLSKKFMFITFCFWQCHALTSGLQSTDLAVNLTWTQKCGHCHVKEGNSLRS